MPSPISFEQFKSNPIAGIAFIAVISVGVLFYELRNSYNEQLENQDQRIEKLENKIDEYQKRLEEVNQKLIECLAVRNQ